MNTSIAVVGMACVYADARSPRQLWENVLSKRRAFRRIPHERLSLEDYFSADRNTPDSIYITKAAVIEGYEFDRVRFRVGGSTYRSADLTHWLALDVAAQALEDAGFPEGEGLPNEMTGVLLGNTLTGEFSRANVMRLRWPYVRRVVEASLIKEGRSQDEIEEFLSNLKDQYNAPFPNVGEETLAGGMSNTIAGRICNYFDLKGGGYTLDGACASSLLATANACSSLIAGDLDVALAGGVDLSLDPFELVGFAKTGALASDEMRVFDARSDGFWPGEGCGFLVLMRYEDAIEQQKRIYAVIQGWGVSSDGSGGITRPEVDGQILALKRAYRRAGFGIDTVGYFEGHGTGTAIGDATELRTISRARREANLHPNAATIGSVKANIGHTKAAAGVAGLIKATMALSTQILPPNTGVRQPGPELCGESPALRTDIQGRAWPTDVPLRAGVSSMGFGGINAHIVLESLESSRRDSLTPDEQSLLSSSQDAEVFLLGAEDSDEMLTRVERLIAFASKLSYAEMGDLAATLEQAIDSHGVRAAIVASSPEELSECLEMLKGWIAGGETSRLDVQSGVFLGSGGGEPRIGFLFPGQGSPVDPGGGALRNRFGFLRDLYSETDKTTGMDITATELMQPAIATSSIAGLKVLDELNIRGSVGVGHSLGEITALCWAGAIDAQELLRIVAARGKAMAEYGNPNGAMASIGTGQSGVQELINGDNAVISATNSPRQTVVSGEKLAVDKIVARAQARNLKAVGLPVSHAFHSPLIAEAAPVFHKYLANEDFHPLQKTVVSTVTGTPLDREENLRDLLVKQMTHPVKFTKAMILADNDVDLWIEAGPGRVLSTLAGDFISTPALAMDASGKSVKPLLQIVGAAFAMGAPVNHRAMFANRFTRPFDLHWQPKFFENPCEQAPVSTGNGHVKAAALPARKDTELESVTSLTETRPTSPEMLPLELVRQLVAEWAELPLSAIKNDSHLLTDLHMNSIAVGEIVAECARRLELPPSASPTDYADATIENVADALEERIHTGDFTFLKESERLPAGVDSWVRAFTVELVERALPRRAAASESGKWQIISSQGHPLKDSIARAFDKAEIGIGVAVCVPANPDEGCVSVLLEGARTALNDRQIRRIAFVQSGGGAASFAKTLHLEAPWINTVVVDVPFDHPNAAEWVVAEISTASGFVEAHYDSEGTRFEPRLQLIQPDTDSEAIDLGVSDVLLVTGGGKGIAAESALSLARETGVRLGLLGRSQPSLDAELASNLRRMDSAGVEYLYISADVNDAQAIKSAVAEIESTLGTVTAVLHGAGANVPRLLNDLDEEDFLKTLKPKVQGARNVLDAVDADSLRLFITFGSIIARTGMRGEADYAVANEWLTRLTEDFQARHPQCRCLAIEWSVWSGVGMGERLGRIDALVYQGIAPISPDEGVSITRDLISRPLPGVAVVVTGRYGESSTLKVDKPELPLLRFLERPRAHYPGVELVVDTELSVHTDPYLNDHVFQGEKILPGVMGLEAAAQAAMALVESEAPPNFKNVKFLRPIVVPQDSPIVLRVAALVTGPNRVDVIVRSSRTDFQVDHFHAACVFENTEAMYEKKVTLLDSHSVKSDHLSVDPEHDLYGGILFHKGRFQRLEGYSLLRAKECIAEISPGKTSDWFVQYLPGEFVLGDPASRDAAIHAIQSCIPQSTLLPTGVDSITSIWSKAYGPTFVFAKERLHEGSDFTYDIEVADSTGNVQERWKGLHLHMMAGSELQGSWPEPLLAPYIERTVSEMIPGGELAVGISLTEDDDRQSRSDRAIKGLLGISARIQSRPDGKPELSGYDDVGVSFSHAGNITLAAVGAGRIGCDVEPVKARSSSVWRDLLGPEGFKLAEYLAHEVNEGLDSAATRIWSSIECLKKSGESVVNARMAFSSSRDDGWVTLTAGHLSIATLVCNVRSTDDALVFAVLARGNDARV